MFDFLRNFFKPVDAENVFQQTSPRQAPASTQPQPGAPQFRAKHPRQTFPQPSPDATSQGSRSSGGATSINIPLAAVLNALPQELKGRVRQIEVGDATLSISVDRVLSQLPQGAVTLSFGELRKAAPELFTSAGDFDQVEVALPLPEILSRINPATLARRQNQKQIEVPPEINSPFGDQGHGLVFSVGPSKSSAAAPPQSAAPDCPTPSEPEPQKLFQQKPFSPTSVHRTPASANPAQPLSKQSPPFQFTQKPSPISPTFATRSTNPLPVPSTPIQPVPMRNSVTPKAAPTPPANVSDDSPIAIPISSALRNLGASIGTPAQANGTGMQPARAREVAPQPAKPSVEVPALSLPLSTLSESWPEALRHEISQLRLNEAQVALPVDQIEAAMKRGKVAFPWKTLRSWIRPTPLPTVSAHDAAVLELPLKVIAPLFLSRKRDSAKLQQKVALDEAIPNLFFGFPQSDSETTTPTAQATPEASPSAPSAPPPSSHPVTKPVETNYYVWDDSSDSAKVDETEFKRKPSVETNFLSRYATPNEVVARAAGLEGVVGALVALPDGLMVASKLSPDLNGDTLAAFLPQIFGKVSQCTKELRMGDLNNLNFTVGNVPWKIFRVNAIFFAAFGRAGQGLPTAQLSALAAELDRKKQ
jgi:predicted regulator of Ras-like GTPase activity (Roadblock/LC7/MglB family)